MQRNRAAGNPALAQLRQNFRREMQARRRRGNRAGLARENRLIAHVIVRALGGRGLLAVNVRRQRRLPDARENLQPRRGRFHPYLHPPKFPLLQNGHRAETVIQNNRLTGARPTPRAHQRIPCVRRDLFQQQKLHPPARSLLGLSPEETRGNHAGVVHHQIIAST